MPRDQRLHLLRNPRSEHRVLKNSYVLRSHRSGASLPQRFGRRSSEAVGCQAEQHGGLSSSQIITNRLARGDGISPDAKHLVTQGERDAGMSAEAVQSAMSRVSPTAGRCAKGQWARHCVGA